uniref:Armadillo repeat containing 5 n=1 Tax=Salmo trutta TaxID=8032 RepID=A0A673XEA1_SALTR
PPVYRPTSLTWCLSQLSKPGRAAAEDHKPGTAGPDTSGHRQLDKRVKAGQWQALVAIRTQHIKGGSSGIARFRGQGGLRILLDLLKHPECSRKTLDLALSILANCCTERQTRVEVRQKGFALPFLVGILKKNVAMETIQNRAARALGNLAMDPESSTLIHSAGGVPLLLLCVSLASCAQSAARAILYLADTPSNRLLLLTQGTLTALAPLIAPEYPLGLRRAALRTLHELTRGCGVECAREVSRSGVLAQLGVMASGEADKPFEELALKTLANMCTQGCLRPLVGSLGVIQKFTEEVKKDGLKSGVFLKALCLCCKEAVNRAKVKESGGLEVLIGFLGVHRSHPLDRLVILACVDFVYDEAALEQLQELGIVPLLVARLVELAKGEEPSAGKMDVSLTSTMFASELLSTSSQPASSTSTPRAQPISSTSTPRAQPISSTSSLPSPTIPPLTPVSPSKFSSPPRKRPRVPSTTRSSVVPLDTPPTVSRPQAYHHPYHPEPWAPESPILLLLSRFSHATDPSAALVNSGIISGLLFYLSQHQDPSGRCFRMLCRLSCNPNCLQALVRTGSVALIRHHLVQRGSDPESWGAGERQTDRKLLLDNGGLLLALEPLGCNEDEEEEDRHTSECRRLLSDCLNSPQHVSAPQLHSLYFSLLIGCLSSLMGCPKTVLAKRRCRVLSPIKPLSVSQTGKALPPPLKKPRLVNICPYNDSTFDLLFLLDDGSQVSANREAVAGAEGTEVVGSEYFRALLRGGFGEAQGRTGEAIPIRDVSQGMLLPVLHYLHGCRLNKDGETAEEQGDETEREGRGECQILGSLASEGLGVWRDGAEEPSPEAQGFQKTPLAETMMGACRFLVTELQREVEDLCVSLLSCSAKNAGRIADVGKKPPSNMDQYGSDGESADESLANRTSGLELSGSEAQTDSLAPTVTAGQAVSLHGSGLHPCQQTEGRRHSAPGPGQNGDSAPKTTSGLETCVNPLKSSSASKCCKRRSKLQSVSNTQKVADSVQDSKVGPGRWTLLPQVYWFSQRYSYPGLGRACLSLLLGSQGSSQPRPSSLAADCLRRLAREADCTETLKRDLVSLATMALS